MTDTTAGAGNRPINVRASFTERKIETIARRILPRGLSGELIILSPSGRSMSIGVADAAPPARLAIKSWRVIARAVQRGANGFAESYLRGEIDTPDLTALVRFFARNKSALVAAGGALFTSRSLDRLAHALRKNTVSGSRRNISAHYDLGNDFYAAWLDPSMTYSAALFGKSDLSLVQAQAAKYATILEALQLSPGAHVLEIGCGWGGFVEHALEACNLNVRAITVSEEQRAFAAHRVAVHERHQNAAVCLEDYRHTSGTFDGIVSIEMVEAVGEENWPTYFNTLHDRLKPGASAVIQAITIAPEHFDRYRRKADFVQRYIFPGGMLPTVPIMQEHAARAGLSSQTVVEFGADYAKTLRLWRERFEASWPDIEQQGFDARFRRMWNYYLCYCEAAFLEGLTTVGIYRFTKPAK
ncbi:MAG: class I SAM-dependent methyltransferase [Rhizobiales bacterium]|nr:class I SAM-dependent methyltransferase [Hyphomicrobiales bacterium]